MKKVKRQSLSVRIGGKTYKGSCTIVGTRKLTQTIHYHRKSHVDTTVWSPSRKTLMKWVASYMLGEMVLQEYYASQIRSAKGK